MFAIVRAGVIEKKSIETTEENRANWELFAKAFWN